MTVRELIHESGIDIQTEYVIKRYDEDAVETFEIDENDALDMEIQYIYYDRGGIIVFEV